MALVSSDELAVDGAATVIIGQRVLAGRVPAYLRWQYDLNGVAASFAGFLSSQVSAPAGSQEDWTVVYRFDTAPHLTDWLESSTRRTLLGAQSDLFASPPTQQVVVGQADEQLETVIVSHPVMPELEEEFIAWQARMTDAERAFPGFRGSELFRPVAGVQENWTSIYRFNSPEQLTRWLESDERRELLRAGERFQDFNLRKVSSSFGSWFSFGGDGRAQSPPEWKTALSVLVGLYPTVVLITLAINAIWHHAPLWAGLLVGNVVSVSVLTWVVMPTVTRSLRFWLLPKRDAAQPQTDGGGVLLSLAVLTVCAIIFWLVTVVIWHLP